MYEFSIAGQWHTNSHAYETKLTTLSLPVSPYGAVTSTVGTPPTPGQPHVRIANGGAFGVEVRGPHPGDPPVVLRGAALLDLALMFEVRGGGGGNQAHAVRLEVRGHHEGPIAGHFYELHKIDPVSLESLGPLCEEDSAGQRHAKIFHGLSIDAPTGTIDYVSPDIHHIACTSSAPGKAGEFGYAPAMVPLSVYALANRVIRADYCADGHPYTYPGNLVGMTDNVSPGEVGTTLADVEGDLGPDEQLEAVWSPDGVMCMGTPRASNLSREDVICPVKHFADGTIAYNWRPPSCDGFVDQPPPGALRFYSKSEP